jgi:hypothetical protein
MIFTAPGFAPLVVNMYDELSLVFLSSHVRSGTTTAYECYNNMLIIHHLAATVPYYKTAVHGYDIYFSVNCINCIMTIPRPLFLESSDKANNLLFGVINNERPIMTKDRFRSTGCNIKQGKG